MASNSLRELIRKPVTNSTALSIMREVRGMDLRASVIVSAAMIDTFLARLLRSRMRKLSPDDDAALFTGTSPLAAFSARIRMVYALGLIGPKTRHDLQTINELRNLFAHSPHRVTLKNKKVLNRIRGLHLWSYFLLHDKGPKTLEAKLYRILSVYVLLFMFASGRGNHHLKPVKGDLAH